ncbi:MAG: insulinase family protein [Candidatus Bathyarchaeota archaeon]|nr:insulinase family protein [Candidatus Bathyarchaeota archaeon]
MSANLVWRRQTLPNGLTAIVYPRRNANTTQLSLAVKYGSNQEPKTAAGVAHFIEHMLAGGSDKKIKRSRSIEEAGGVLDFYTDREHVLGAADVLPSKLTDASEILCDLFFGDEFDEAKFELERKIILNELAEVSDDPTVKLEELLLENLYRRHPIQRPVGGYPKTIKKLTLSQLLNEHRCHYVPQNMVLVLTGKVGEGDEMRVLEAFKNKECPANQPRQQWPQESGKPKSVIVEEKAGITQTYLAVGARTVYATHPDAPVLDLIGTLLGGGTTSRLFIELREKHAVTYDVSSGHCKGTDFGYLSVNCAVGNRKVEKTRRLIFAELSDLGKRKVSEVELERAKAIMLGGVLRGMDDPHDTTEIITYMEMQFGNDSALKDYVTKIREVSCEDIRRASAEHLNEDTLCTVIIKPIK